MTPPVGLPELFGQLPAFLAVTAKVGQVTIRIELLLAAGGFFLPGSVELGFQFGRSTASGRRDVGNLAFDLGEGVEQAIVLLLSGLERFALLAHVRRRELALFRLQGDELSRGFGVGPALPGFGKGGLVRGKRFLVETHFGVARGQFPDTLLHLLVE